MDGDSDCTLDSEMLELPVEEVRELQLKYEERGRVMAEYLRIIDMVRGECQQYHQKVEQLQNINLQQQDQTSELGKQLAALTELKAANERALEEKVALWTQKYEAKARDHELLQGQIVPSREMEVMRMQIMDDFEKPYKEKLAYFEQEAERYREQFFVLRREHETLRQTLVQTKLDSANAVEDAKARGDRDVAILTDRLRVLQTVIDDAPDADKVLHLERDKAELDIRCRLLQTEVDGLREDTERLKLLKGKAAVSYQMELGDEMTKAKSLQAENDGLHRRVRHLEKELSAAVKSHDRLHDRILVLERDSGALRTQLDEAQHALTSERTASARRVTELESEWNAERAEHHKDLESLHSQLTEVQSQYSEAQTRIATQEKDCFLRVKRARDEEHEKIVRLELAVTTVEKELESARRIDDEKTASKNIEIQNLQKELSLLRTDKRGLGLELKTAGERTERLLLDLQQLKAEHEGSLRLVHEQQEEIKKVSGKLEKAVAREAALRLSKQETDEQCEFLQRDMASLQGEIAAERDSHVAALSHVKRQVAKERTIHSLVAQQLRQDLDAALKDRSVLKSSCDKQTEALKDRVRKYRSKLQLVMGRLAQSEYERAAITTADC
eukprot:gnl/Hemi2/12607_TR4314_c0_g1_i1.p1 gnl/Hemi2/12607_TR4314_c0_g1~~gnl/Hemi2/12607_TR4314_c0_g1_i1.p1  ORF type:complete len:616 (-),score=289.92 gnl/Hemi2/12607_TR4314_c0_g1_i1:278-2125(-)